MRVLATFIDARIRAAEKYCRARRGRNPHRPDAALQWTGLRLRHHRPGAGGLFREGQRRRRHQRPQDQVHQPRRRVLAAQDGRADAQAGRTGRSAADVRFARATATNNEGASEVPSCSAGRPNGPIRRISAGPCRAWRPTSPRASSMPSISCAPSLDAQNRRSCSRTTIFAAITSPASSAASATRPPP